MSQYITRSWQSFWTSLDEVKGHVFDMVEQEFKAILVVVDISMLNSTIVHPTISNPATSQTPATVTELQMALQTMIASYAAINSEHMQNLVNEGIFNTTRPGQHTNSPTPALTHPMSPTSSSSQICQVNDIDEPDINPQ